MYAFGSFLVITITVLVFATADFPPPSSYRCRLPSYFRVGTTDQNKADVYDAQLGVSVAKRPYSITSYPGSNTITFQVLDVSVNFDGVVVTDETQSGRESQTRTNQYLLNRIVGVAQRVKKNNITSSVINDCHGFLLPIAYERITVPPALEAAIRGAVESCIVPTICEEVGKQMYRAMPGLPNMSGLAQLPGLTGPNPYIKPLDGPMPFQNALNRLIDGGLTTLIQNLKTTGQNTIRLPDIDTPFMAPQDSLQIPGRFQATSGRLSGLTNLIRSTPAIISHTGRRFTISSRITINAAMMTYNYKLTHGSLKSEGIWTVRTNAIHLDAGYIADYSGNPCQTRVDHLKATGFEPFTATFTNAGSLNPLVTERNWLNNKVLADIKQTIERRLQDSARSMLMYFNCESFRT